MKPEDQGMAVYSGPDWPVKQYFYKVEGCKAKYTNSPDCICWHDIGTGPLANEPQYQTSFREKPKPVQPACEQGEILFEAGKAAGRQEVKDAQSEPDFWAWVRKAYREPESTNFTIHNMEVAYQAGRESAAAINEQLLEALKCAECELLMYRSKAQWENYRQQTLDIVSDAIAAAEANYKEQK